MAFAHRPHDAARCGPQGEKQGSRVYERDLPAGERFETEILSPRKNLTAPVVLSATWTDSVH